MRRAISVTLHLALAARCSHAFFNPPPPRMFSSSLASSAQVLDFVEPTTGVQVKLVGAMHYNPASIEVAVNEINKLHDEGKLGTIVIESCEQRWNSTLESQVIKEALLSEMKAAHDLGLKYNVPVVLGDQDINVTVAALKDGAKEAFLDLLQPWNGGWNRLADSISTARDEALPSGPQYLGPGSFFDAKLLSSAPVSFIKYPLSYFIKSPAFALAVTVLLVLGSIEDANAATDAMSTTDLAESLTVSVLETAVFARVFLKELLSERNDVLASNIFQQCLNYQRQDTEANWFGKIFSQQATGDRATNAVYAPDSVVATPSEGKTVVAVLGLAHCNGIKKIMTEGK